ncbi:MAG: hypothetical protein V4547_15110 [Bacteroidota bacterium]
MKSNIQIINVVNNILILILLSIIVGQMYITFLKYEEKFESPVQFIKKNYGNDYITLYGNRYEEVKKIFIKPSHFSYFGEANEDYGTGAMHFALTRYYLTPNIISIDGIVCDTILYNLYSSVHINPETNFHLNNGWHIVKDFNNGLIVLAK